MTNNHRPLQHRDISDPIDRTVREHFDRLDIAAIHHGPLARDLVSEVNDLIVRAQTEATSTVDGLRGQVDAALGVLNEIAADYYIGCQAYADTAADGPDNPKRVFYRIRLGALEEFGRKLAAALDTAPPDWEFMREQAGEA
jgi:hypothetical protein